MAKKVHASELPPDVQAKLGLPTGRKSTFNRGQVRTWSLKILALMADLSQTERRRVLQHAMKVNEV